MSQPTKTQLLKAAEFLLIKQGVRALSVRKIGEVAGLNPTLVTYHFGTVANLLRELCSRNLDPMIEAWAPLSDPTFVQSASFETLLSMWLEPLTFKAAFHQGGRALIVVDEIAAHGEKDISQSVLDRMFAVGTRVSAAMVEHLPHLTSHEIRARLRFISGATLGPPPRVPGEAGGAAGGGPALDNYEYLLRFARAALERT